MPAHQLERTVRQSLLDRLIDDGSYRSETASLDESIAMLKTAVLRDLHWLLNTRRVQSAVPAALDLVRDSIYTFGLGDLTSRSADSEATRQELKREIEDAITTFEPRLTNVRVTLPGGTNDYGVVRFHVDARLRADPAPETVQFETTLHVASKSIVVKERSDA